MLMDVNDSQWMLMDDISTVNGCFQNQQKPTKPTKTMVDEC